MRRGRNLAAAGLVLALLWWAFSPSSTPERTPRSERPQVAAIRERLKHLPPPASPAPQQKPKSEAPLNETQVPATDPTPLNKEGLLVVDVVDEEGRTDERAKVFLAGCQARGASFRSWRVKQGDTCLVRAWRPDGALSARADPVQILIDGADTAYVEVVLPAARTGGLGVQIGWSNGAIVVGRVFPGTPAALQGLEAGDRIIEVDGVPVGELGLRGFVQAMTGPEGTDVEFVLEYSEEGDVVHEPLTITRQFFES